MARHAPTEMFDPRNHHRRSVRLPHYDYREAGAYFITVCAAHKRPVFGRLESGAVRLHPYGKFVEEEWVRTAALRPQVELDEFIIMPDHFHAIIIIRRGMACHAQNPAQPEAPEEGMTRHAPTRKFAEPQAQSLATIVGAFKAAVTRCINRHRAERDLPPVTIWQRSFYERIIHNETELLENPLHTKHS